MRTLVVVPCGAKKIWSEHPSRGAVRAAEAYVGVPFRVNRAYAEVVGDAWVILSAKYGFLAPDDLLNGPYEVTFKRKKTNPVAVETLQRQVEERGLASFDRVIGLGGVEYRAALTEAFRDHAEVAFPFAGLALGYSLQATKAAMAAAAQHALQ